MSVSSVALIVNPRARRVDAALRAAAVRALADRGLESVLVTRASGDGTANEVAGAIAGGGTAMTALPAGGTNIFARALGWPAAPAFALEALVHALARPRMRTLRLGELGLGPPGERASRVFCVNAGVGLDAETVHLVEAHQGLKRTLGQAGFILAAAKSFGRRARLATRVDGGEEMELATVVAACGAPYAYLGRRRLDLVPDAAFDGELEWLGLRRARPHEVAVIAARALDGGRHLEHPALAHGFARDSIEIHSEPEAAVQSDGEPLGRHADIAIRPGPEITTLAPPA